MNDLYGYGLALAGVTSVGDTFTAHLKISFASVITTRMQNEGGYFSGREHTFNLTFSCWTWGSQFPGLIPSYIPPNFPSHISNNHSILHTKHRQMGSCVIICNSIEKIFFFFLLLLAPSPEFCKINIQILQALFSFAMKWSLPITFLLQFSLVRYIICGWKSLM